MEILGKKGTRDNVSLYRKGSVNPETKDAHNTDAFQTTKGTTTDRIQKEKNDTK